MEFSAEQRQKAAERCWLRSGTYEAVGNKGGIHTTSDLRDGWMKMAMQPGAPGNQIGREVDLQCQLNRAVELLRQMDVEPVDEEEWEQRRKLRSRVWDFLSAFPEGGGSK